MAIFGSVLFIREFLLYKLLLFRCEKNANLDAQHNWILKIFTS